MTMKERPILFTPENVRAILKGSKSQTRRIVKLPHENPLGQWEPSTMGGPGCYADKAMTIPVSEHPVIWHTRTGDCIGCPYGQPGDRLWVRETWADVNTDSGPALMYRAGGYHFCSDDAFPVEYDRYPKCNFTMWCGDLQRGEPDHAWRPSIFMPRWACRLVLELTEVRVERLQDCSESDAIAEGAESFEGDCILREERLGKAQLQYAALWESINGAGSWDLNPFVWVLSFRPVEAL